MGVGTPVHWVHVALYFDFGEKKMANGLAKLNGIFYC